MLLLVAGAVGVWAVSGRDEADAPAAPTTVIGRGDGTEFRVVATEPVGNADARSIRAAGTDDDLVSIVSRFGPDFAPFAAEVDLSREVALVIERPDNSCPAEIDRFEPVDDTWEVVWRKPGGDCDDVGFGWVYLVAIDRSALAGIEWFVLPAEQHGSLSWEELRVAVPADPALGPTFTSWTDGGIDGTFPAHDIAVITDQAEWDAYVASDMPLVEDSAVDLTEFVVVVIRRPDTEGCPGFFDGFDVSEDAWTPRFVAVDAEGCFDTQMTTRYDVAVRRAALPDEVTFHLPADAVFDLPAAEVTVRVREQSTPGDTAQAALDAAVSVLIDTDVDSLMIRPGAVGTAASTEQLDALWTTFTTNLPRPDVDLASDVVLAFEFLDDGCRASFDRLTLEASDEIARIVVSLVEPTDGDCEVAQRERLIVLAVGRAGGLPTSFDFVVPAPYAPHVTTRLSPEAPTTTTIDLGAPTTSSTTLVIDPAVVVSPMSFAPSDATLDALENRLGMVSMFSRSISRQFAVIAFPVLPGELRVDVRPVRHRRDGVWTPLFRESGPCDEDSHVSWR